MNDSPSTNNSTGVEDTNDTYLTPTYARDSFGEPNNVTTLPEDSMDPREVLQMIYNRIDLDFRNSSDLGSYNFDYMDPEADELRQRVAGKVFIDKETYVQTAALGDAVSDMIQNWYGGVPLSPQGKANNRLVGTVTIGSSEAIMLGLMAHRQNWLEQWKINYEQDPKSWRFDVPFLMYARDVHTCWEKYSVYFDVPALVFDMSDNNYLLNPDDISKYLQMSLLALRQSSEIGDPVAARFWALIYDKCRFSALTTSKLEDYITNKYVSDLVICVGTVLGTTFTGQGDPIEEINTRLHGINDNFNFNGYQIPIHVDAASGGFVVPFTDPELIWDYNLQFVKSINVSNHKFGSTYPGCGTITFRDETVVPKDLIWVITYLGGAFTDYTVNFSRDSAGPLSAYYNLVRFGKEGFSEQNVQCTTNAANFAQQLSTLRIGTEPLFEVISDNQRYPIVVWRISQGVEGDIGWNLTQLADLLQEDAWKLPAYRLPYDSSREPNGPYVCRVVTRPDVSAEKLDILFNDIQSAIATLNDMYPAVVQSDEARALVDKQRNRLERTGSGDYFA